jgi:hypothetical protein
MNICPSKVKTLDTFKVVKPVTHTADADVKRASIKVIPECVALGSFNMRVPAKMTIT